MKIIAAFLISILCLNAKAASCDFFQVIAGQGSGSIWMVGEGIDSIMIPRKTTYSQQIEQVVSTIRNLARNGECTIVEKPCSIRDGTRSSAVFIDRGHFSLDVKTRKTIGALNFTQEAEATRALAILQQARLCKPAERR